MKLFKFFQRQPTKKEISMEHFSNEFRDKLIAEHKLTSAAINTLLTAASGKYNGRVGLDIVTAAVYKLKVEKLELEAKIDVLDEFLNG
jgi:hypothetical protein